MALRFVSLKVVEAKCEPRVAAGTIVIGKWHHAVVVCQSSHVYE